MAEEKEGFTLKLDNTGLFGKNVATLREQWQLWRKSAKADALVFLAGSYDANDAAYTKASAMQTWLFGVNVTNVLLILLENSILVVTGAGNGKYFKELSAHNKDLHLVVFSAKRAVKDGFKSVIEAIKASFDGKMVSLLQKEPQHGKFADEFTSALNASGLEKVEATPFVSSLLFKKNDQEIKFMKAASSVSFAIVKNFLFGKLQSFKNEGKNPTLNELSEMCAGLFVTTAKISKKLNVEVVDAAYTPIVRSGKITDFVQFEKPSEKAVDFQVVSVEIGTRMKNYCAEIARTFLSAPTEQQKKDYDFLVKLFAHVQSQIKAKAGLSDVYNSGVKFTQENRPDLVDKLTSNFGYSIGVEVIDPRFLIKKDITRTFTEGQAFTLRVGLHSLSDGPKEYGMILADVILVTATGVENWTQDKAKHAIENVLLDAAPKDAATKTTEGGDVQGVKRAREDDGKDEPASKQQKKE